MDTTVLLFVATLLVVVNIAANQEVTVEFTSDTNDYKIGDAALLSCEVIGSFNLKTDDLLVVRKGIRGKTTTIARIEGKHPDAPDSVILVSWYESLSTMHVVLNIMSGYDWGTYTCKAIRQESVDASQLLAQQSITIDFLYPPLGLPLCKTQQNKTWYEGDEVTLQCMSDTGKPSASLEWYQSSGTSLPKSKVETSLGIITASVTFDLDLDHNDVIFNCTRLNNDLSSSPESTCLLGPLTVLNKTETAMSFKEIGVIAGIAVVPLFIVILCIVFIVLLIRSRRSKPPNDYETPDEDVGQGILLGGVPENSKQKLEPKDSNNLESPDISKPSPNPPAIYASVQKNKANGEPIPAGRKSKVYPNPPSYPRPPKSRESIKVGEQYANSTVGENKSNAQPESRLNGVYQNPHTSQDNLSALPPTNNSKYKVEKTYSNTLDVGITDNKEPQRISEYANTSDAVTSPRGAAPTQSPPPPPSSPIDEESSIKKSKHTPGLNYAELDMVKPSVSTPKKSGFFSEPVAYAAMKS